MTYNVFGGTLNSTLLYLRSTHFTIKNSNNKPLSVTHLFPSLSSASYTHNTDNVAIMAGINTKTKLLIVNAMDNESIL